MTGIMVAVAGTVQNSPLLAPGLYIVESASVQQSPITGSASSTGSNTVNVTRNWIGYFLPASTGNVNLSIQVSATVDFNSITGTASTTGRLWLGDAAIAGNTAQANISISRTFGFGTSTATFNLISGVNYPLRIRWDGSYFGGVGDDGFSIVNTTSSGSITFLVNSSSNVSNRIFYNQIAPPGF
jgi:hypothetical protein